MVFLWALSTQPVEAGTSHELALTLSEEVETQVRPQCDTKMVKSDMRICTQKV